MNLVGKATVESKSTLLAAKHIADVRTKPWILATSQYSFLRRSNYTCSCSLSRSGSSPLHHVRWSEASNKTKKKLENKFTVWAPLKLPLKVSKELALELARLSSGLSWGWWQWCWLIFSYQLGEASDYRVCPVLCRTRSREQPLSLWQLRVRAARCMVFW